MATNSEDSGFNHTQCAIAFLPTMFTVSANLTSKQITVTPTTRPDVDDSRLPDIAITANAVQSVDSLSRVSNPSALNDALTRNLWNAVSDVGHVMITSRDQISSVEDALAAVLDDTLDSYGAAQMVNIAHDTVETDVTVVGMMVRVGVARWVNLATGFSVVVVVVQVAGVLWTWFGLSWGVGWFRWGGWLLWVRGEGGLLRGFGLAEWKGWEVVGWNGVCGMASRWMMVELVVSAASRTTHSHSIWNGTRMADIAFGVVGVAGLAIQLADSLKKLQAFATLVKEAPSELRELIEYIDTSRQWLDSISITPVAAMDSTSTLRCESLCRKAVERLAVAASELEQGMQTKKRRTALKLAWTTDVMERLRRRLESSKVDLHNAHSMFVAEQIRTDLSTEGRRIRDTMVDLNSEAHARHQELDHGVTKMRSGQMIMERMITTGQHENQQNFTHIGKEVQMSQRMQQQGFSSILKRQQNLHHSLNTAQARSQQHMRMQTSLIAGHFDTGQARTMSRIEHVLDALLVLSAAITHSPLRASQTIQSPQINTRHRPAHKPYKSARTYRLRLLSKVFSLSMQRAVAGWDFSLRTYRIIPYSDRRWEPFKTANITGIYLAMCEGIISPYDRDSSGQSPIEHVIHSLQYGYGSDEFVERMEQVHEIFTKIRMPLLLNQNALATIEVLWAADRTHLSTPRAGALARKLLRTPSFNANIPEEIMEALAKQPSIWTTEERLQLLCWIVNARTYFDDFAIIIDVLIGLDLTSSVATSMPEPDGSTVMYALAIAFCESHHRRKDDLDRLKELLRTYVQSGAYRLDRQDWRMTPLTTLTDLCLSSRYLQDFAAAVSTGIERSWAEGSTEILQSWAQSLHLAGVDLESYGRAEMDTLRLWRKDRWGDQDFLVVYGPEVADWAVLDMQAGHSYAGLFWHVIEHPEENMPGAWCDNNDSSVACEDEQVGRMSYDKEYRKMLGFQAYHQSQGRNRELLRLIRIEFHLGTN
ncbi:hypothetical protein LTR15_008459 [Elasticomyces elasticus]|nr:hypothetical protein LTR15_008459 [Elasticomyces elasticus]